MKRLGVFSVAVLCAAGPADAITNVVGAVVMNGAQEVPPNASSAIGVALVSYDRTNRNFSYHIQHNVGGPNNAHLHGAAGVGTNAGVLFGLSSFTSPILGSQTLTPAQERSFLDGYTYFNVHSGAFPGGEIRGQLLVGAAAYCTMDGTQQVPAVSSSAMGTGLFTYDRATRALGYVITHNVASGSAVHIHGPAGFGANAGVLFDLGTVVNPLTGTVTLTKADEVDFAFGRLYVNIHTTNNPGGEIRGQIIPMDLTPAYNLTARLTSGEEVPPLTNAFSGVALLAYERPARRLTVDLQYTVDVPTGAHIHGPAGVGTNAAILFDLTTNANPVRQVFTLTAPQEADLLRGLYYINVHTTGSPSGAIRGQILGTEKLTARIGGREETPQLTSSRGGLAAFTYDRASRTLGWRVEHNVTNATAAHIHGPGAPGVAAAVLFNIGATNPAVGSTVLTPVQERDLLRGLYYVNVHTTNNPGGEIRGQVLPIEPVPVVTHPALLLGSSEVAPVATTNGGIALISYDCGNRILSYDIQHTITNPTGAHIHGPAGAGTNAPILFDFGAAASPIRGTVTLSASQDADFRAGLYYVNIHSATFPAGEIRGQLVRGLRFAAALQNRQEVPATSTDGAGRGVFLWQPATTTLTWSVLHSVSGATAAHIHGPAAPGVNAGVLFPIALGATNLHTGSSVLAPAQVTQLFQGLLYVNVHSGLHPGGEVRGQIHETGPDDDCDLMNDWWELDHGLSVTTNNAAADDDGDLATNLEEFIADTAPGDGAQFLRLGGIRQDGGTNLVTFDTSAFRAYNVEANVDLMTGAWLRILIRTNGTGGAVTCHDTGAFTNRFYRIGAELP